MKNTTRSTKSTQLLNLAYCEAVQHITSEGEVLRALCFARAMGAEVSAVVLAEVNELGDTYQEFVNNAGFDDMTVPDKVRQARVECAMMAQIKMGFNDDGAKDYALYALGLENTSNLFAELEALDLEALANKGEWSTVVDAARAVQYARKAA